MDETLEFLVRHGHTVVFAWVLLDQLGLPLPAIPVLLGAGALAGAGRLDGTLVIAAVVAASLLGDSAWYAIGRRLGGRVLRWLCRVALEPDSCVRRSEVSFGRHGASSLIVAKFVPGLSTVAPPLAGIMGMSMWRFAGYSGLAGLLWAMTFVGLGWVFADQLERLVAHAARLGTGLAALAAVALAAHVAVKWAARRRFLRRIAMARIAPEALKAMLDAGETPLIVDLRHAVDFDAEPAVIPGALHITTEELEHRHREIPRDRDVILYCT
jgi:membrane protein DedA with SNARE-associated domain